MTRLLVHVGVAFSILATSAYSAEQAASPGAMQNWAQWRGPLSTGVAPEADPPLEWSGRDGKNIRWKTKLPGRGHSTPIVWGDRVFVTTAVPFGDPVPPQHTKAKGSHDNIPATHRHKFVVIALDRREGRILWERTVREAMPHDGGGHYTASLASNSPATDGEQVYAFFGSQGLYCLDFKGAVRWSADLGKLHPLHGHGEGSSPALFGDTLVVNWDHEEKSFLVAFDTRTGKERWKVARDEITSWGSPIIIVHDGVPQVVVSATNRVRGYDLANGKVLWECGGLSTNVVASPVYSDGMVYTGSSYDTRAFLAINLKGAKGDLTGSKHVVWSRNRATPYVPSPLLYGDGLYFLNHYQGILTRLNARTGADQPGIFRLAGIEDVYASPVGAAGRVYFTDRDGTTLVISHAEQPKVLAENQIDDVFNASAAIAGRELFLRGEKFLYCLGDD